MHRSSQRFPPSFPPSASTPSPPTSPTAPPSNASWTSPSLSRATSTSSSTTPASSNAPPAFDHTDADWDAVLADNLNGVFVACRAAGKPRVARSSGKLINIDSLLPFFDSVTIPGYAASKGGVGQLTQALSHEWAAHGVPVNAVASGHLRTDNTAALQADPARSLEILLRSPAHRWGAPSDLEGAVVFLVSPASDYLSGPIIAVDGGWCGR